MKLRDTVFIFGLVFVGIPFIGLIVMVIEMLRGAI
jgi:ABC-type Na+ efflux pump permease subunit|tara:strand:+ start:797 stop:901 length:105 start_codon:yes stop_codon:yes gene_type:complete